MIAILDYGMGNLHSVEKALRHVGATVQVTSDPAYAAEAKGLVLPGVGAFGEAMANLRRLGLDRLVQEKAGQVPLLGICLGQQLLFERSEEMGRHEGLSVLPGRVLAFEGNLKVPHMGWSRVRPVEDLGTDPLLAGLAGGWWAYFAHSYYVQAARPENVLARTEYGLEFPSMVRGERLWGIQFHPEKSGAAGLCLLENFWRLVAR